MKFEQKFIDFIENGFKKHTIRKKPYSCGIHVIQDVDGNDTNVSVEIAVCQKIKVADFLKWTKSASIIYAKEYGFWKVDEMHRYYKKYLSGCEFAYAHRLELISPMFRTLYS
jgi:hypothetical protein